MSGKSLVRRRVDTSANRRLVSLAGKADRIELTHQSASRSTSQFMKSCGPPVMRPVFYVGGNMKQLNLFDRWVPELNSGPSNPRHRVPWPAPAKVEPPSALPKLTFLEMPFNSAGAPCRNNEIRLVSNRCVR